MKRLLALIPVALVIAIGCDPEPKTGAPSSTALNEKSTPSTDPSKGISKDAGTSSPSLSPTTLVGGSSKPETKDDKAPAVPTISTPVVPASKTADSGVPPELKHVGYEYEGLANASSIDMELDISGQSSPITGSQQVTFKGIKDGKASYVVERTGGLEALGSENISLEKDGIYTTHSTVAKLSPHAMELPADPKPGMKWTMHTSADSKTAKMDMEITCKVIGTQSVTTKVGTYKDALLVEQDGVGTLQGKKVRTVSKNWYVKGLGNVKADLTTYDQDGKQAQTLTIQETKH